MAVKRNAVELENEYYGSFFVPLPRISGVKALEEPRTAACRGSYVRTKTRAQAAKAVIQSFYVDDGLVGAQTIQDAQRLRSQLQEFIGV